MVVCAFKHPGRIQLVSPIPPRSIDVYDDQLDHGLKLLKDVFSHHATLTSVRTNLSCVSIMRGPGLVEVIWDELFFDFVLEALMAAGSLRLDQDRKVVRARLAAQSARQVGLRYLLRRPDLAATWIAEANNLMPSIKNDFIFNSSTNKHVSEMFRHIRNYCLLHEASHVMEASLQQLEVNKYNTQNLANHFFFHHENDLVRRMKLLFSGDDLNDVVRRVREEVFREKLYKELRADVNALVLMFAFEFDWEESSPISIEERCRRVMYFSLAYQALAILSDLQERAEWVVLVTSLNDGKWEWAAHLSEPPECTSARIDRFLMNNIRHSLRLHLIHIHSMRLMQSHRGDVLPRVEEFVRRPLYLERYRRASNTAKLLLQYRAEEVCLRAASTGRLHSFELLQEMALDLAGWA